MKYYLEFGIGDCGKRTSIALMQKTDKGRGKSLMVSQSIFVFNFRDFRTGKLHFALNWTKR